MSKQKTALGKGLGALIPTVTDATEKPVTLQKKPTRMEDSNATGIIAHVDVEQVKPNPYQPRVDFDPATIHELAQSILQKGVIQPITVRRIGEGQYQLVAGERRVRACIEAKIKYIPAYIIEVQSKEEMLELALIENLQRERLNPIEVALAYQRLVDECSYSQDQIAERIGKDRTTVSNFMRLLKLPKTIQDSLIKNEISMGHARAIINLASQKDQLAIWEKIVQERLSVRNVERIAQETTKIGETKKKPSRGGEKQKPKQNKQYDDITQRMQQSLGTKVSVSIAKNGKGTIHISFYSADDFNRLAELLMAAE